MYKALTRSELRLLNYPHLAIHNRLAHQALNDNSHHAGSYWHVKNKLALSSEGLQPRVANSLKRRTIHVIEIDANRIESCRLTKRHAGHVPLSGHKLVCSIFYIIQCIPPDMPFYNDITTV